MRMKTIAFSVIVPDGRYPDNPWDYRDSIHKRIESLSLSVLGVYPAEYITRQRINYAAAVKMSEATLPELHQRLRDFKAWGFYPFLPLYLKDGRQDVQLWKWRISDIGRVWNGPRPLIDLGWKVYDLAYEVLMEQDRFVETFLYEDLENRCYCLSTVQVGEDSAVAALDRRLKSYFAPYRVLQGQPPQPCGVERF